MSNITPIVTINEGSTPKLSLTITDENGDLISDSLINTVRIGIFNKDDGTILRTGADSLVPSSGIVTSWLTPAETRIINSNLDYEYRVIIALVLYNSSAKLITAQEYIKILNLKFISVSSAGIITISTGVTIGG